MERESCHYATEENIWRMKEWRLPHYHKQAELVTPTPAPAQAIDLMHGVGKLTFVLVFCLVLCGSMDNRRYPTECKREQTKD